MPKISVIIPTCHRNDLLEKCLGCLAPGVQTLSQDDFEVIVTDDGSRSTAQSMMETSYRWARWTAGPRHGPAANRNNGASLATGDWLVFTDDDCLPLPDWLARYAESMEGEATALEGAILPEGDPNGDLAECPINTDGGAFWSANIAVKRSVFERIGGFDREYIQPAAEDVDLKIRLLRETSIPFVRDAVVMHPVRVDDLLTVLKRIPRQAPAWALHVRKHRAALGFRSYLHAIGNRYLAYLSMLRRSASQRKPKTACKAVCWLVYGVPLMGWHLMKPGRKA